VIDLALWEPYLDAFTRMLRSVASGDPYAAHAHRREMKAYIEVSPDFWRGAALQDDLCNRPRPVTTGWYKQGVRRGGKRRRR
jgi:hypothetical protein